MLRIAPLLFLAACGGSKPPPAPVANTSPPPQAAAPGPTSIEAAIAKAEQFRSMVCACKDKICGDKVDAEMSKWFGARGDEGALTAEQKQRMTDAILMYSRCWQKLQDMP